MITKEEYEEGAAEMSVMSDTEWLSQVIIGIREQAAEQLTTDYWLSKGTTLMADRLQGILGYLVQADNAGTD